MVKSVRLPYAGLENATPNKAKFQNSTASNLADCIGQLSP